MPALTTYTADIQDRDGGPGVIEQACDSFPAPVCIFADGSYSGDGVKDAFKAFDGPAIEIVKRLQGVTGFIVSARRPAPPGVGAYLRPAGTLPPSGKGCRGNHQKRRCLDYHRQHPPHDQPVGKNLISAQPS